MNQYSLVSFSNERKNVSVKTIDDWSDFWITDDLTGLYKTEKPYSDRLIFILFSPTGHASAEHEKHDAQQKGAEVKNQAEQKGKHHVSETMLIDRESRVSGADVQRAANQKVDEVKPKVDEAVRNTEEAGR